MSMGQRMTGKPQMTSCSRYLKVWGLGFRASGFRGWVLGLGVLGGLEFNASGLGV